MSSPVPSLLPPPAAAGSASALGDGPPPLRPLRPLRRVVGFIVPAVVAIVCGFLLLFAKQVIDGREQTIQETSNQAELLSRLVADQAHRALMSVEDTAARVAERARTTDDPASWTVDLRNAVARSTLIRQMTLVDENGVVLASSEAGATGRATLDPALVRRALARRGVLQVGAMQGGRSLGQADAAATDGRRWYLETIYAAPGPAAPLVLAVVNPEYFVASYDALPIGKDATIRLLTYGGQLIARTHAHAGDTIADLGASLAGGPPFTGALQQRESGRYVVDEGDRPWLSAYRVTRTYPLVVTVGLSQDSALAPWRARTWSLAAALGLLGIMVLAATILLVRSLRVRERERQRLAESEATARRTQARLVDAIESMSEGFALFDRGDRLVLWNRQYESFFPYLKPYLRSNLSFASLVEVAARHARLTDDEAGTWTAWRLERHTNPVGAFEQQLSDGRLMLTVERRTAEGGIVSVSRDITRERAASLALERARAAADAANRAKSEFLATVSHEIRTPMNAILGFAELLRRAPQHDPAMARRHLDTILGSGRHLLALINDILDLSKVEAGRLEVERVPCAVHEIVNEVADIMRLRAEEKGVSLAVEFPQALPAAVRTDPARVRQIVTNLIGNALKFTRDGLVSVSIGVHRPPDGAAQLVIDVADTGIGIAPDKLDAIFEPFVQAEASTTRQFGGTGLGLAISRRFARALGGDITVTSVPERGSTFHVTLDAGALEGVAWLAPDALAAAHGRVADAPERSTWRFPARRVLVVDDGVENRELVRVVLEGAGLQVVEAHDGAMALAQVEATRPDLVLMDVQMPVMDGYTATRRLREQGCCLPVLALTANAMKGFETEIAAAGFTGYLTKPVDIDGLLAELARHLGGQRVAEPAESSPEFAAPAPVATAAATPAGAPIVSRLAGHARLARVVRTFGQTLPEKLHAMDEALAAGRFDELAALAHWLKGAGGTVGFDEFFEPARQFEQHARAGRLPELTAGLRELHALAARLVIPADEPVRRAATAAAAADDVTA